VLALDRCRNFARAADEVGLTQPALSRSIQSLERTIGAKLFDRDRSGVEPTAVGARLVELARPLVTQARLAEREIEKLMGLASGLLRIGAGPYASEISVGTAVGRLAKARPGIRVDVAVADWPELHRRLLADELDVVVAEISHALDDNRFAVEPLPEHQAVFYVRAGHPLASRAGLTLHEVTAFPLASPFVPSRLLKLVREGRATDSDRTVEGIVATEFRVETPYLARSIVLESDVVGLALPAQIEREVALGRLVALPLHLPLLKASYGILRLAGRTPSPLARRAASRPRPGSCSSVPDSRGAPRSSRHARSAGRRTA
jgi:DNA-binding transcriptional LysR family regulator